MGLATWRIVPFLVVEGRAAGRKPDHSRRRLRYRPNVRRGDPRLRHAFAGIAPLAAVLGIKLTEADSVTLHGADLAAGGGLVVLGIAASVMAAKALPAAGRAAPAEDRLPIG